MLALAGGGADSDSGPSPHAVQMSTMQEAVKIIHKEHDAVTAFCINKVNDVRTVELLFLSSPFLSTLIVPWLISPHHLHIHRDVQLSLK